jgi:Tfp pilus assembly protein PilO
MAISIPKNETSAKKSNRRDSIMEILFDIDQFTGGELPIEWIKKIVFIASLILIYIYYSMLADGKIHQIVKNKAELEELRADYTTQKAEFMKKGKQSYLAEAMKKYKLEVSLTPPYKIVQEGKSE